MNPGRNESAPLPPRYRIRGTAIGFDSNMPAAGKLGRKVSDEFTVPLCRGHHREVHRSGDEPAWWEKTGIDPTTTARALWLETHPLPAISDKASVEDLASANRQ